MLHFDDLMKTSQVLLAISFIFSYSTVPGRFSFWTDEVGRTAIWQVPASESSSSSVVQVQQLFWLLQTFAGVPQLWHSFGTNLSPKLPEIRAAETDEKDRYFFLGQKTHSTSQNLLFIWHQCSYWQRFLDYFRRKARHRQSRQRRMKMFFHVVYTNGSIADGAFTYTAFYASGIHT